MTVAHAQHLTWRQRVLRHLGTQFGNPRGQLGALFGRTIFARGNAAFNQWVTQQLDVQPDSHILEVGSGPGLTLHTLAPRATTGHVVGLDRSPVMVEQAKQRNLAAIRAGRLDVLQGSAEALPFEDGSFDLVVGIHVLYFWPDPTVTLQELRRVLREGGEVAIGFYLSQYAPRLTQAAFALTGARLAESPESVETLLQAAGYSDIRVAANGHGGYCAIGRKSE
jgi:ubiquinone/menaquinone biosynthesis C-methylase UbiE